MNGILEFGVGYSYNKFLFAESEPALNFSSFQQMQSIRANLAYRRPLKNRWMLGISFGPTLTSNFENGIVGEDFIWNSMISATKIWGDSEKNSALIVGLGYGSLLGEPQLLPIIAFRSKINEKYSYSIGLPSTGFHYTPNTRNRISIELKPEGYFGNNSDTLFVENTGGTITNAKLRIISISAGINYQYKIQPNFSLQFSAGFAPFREINILDDQGNEVFEFESSSAWNFSTGIKYNFKSNSSKKSNTL